MRSTWARAVSTSSTMVLLIVARACRKASARVTILIVVPAMLLFPPVTLQLFQLAPYRPIVRIHFERLFERCDGRLVVKFACVSESDLGIAARGLGIKLQVQLQNRNRRLWLDPDNLLRRD